MSFQFDSHPMFSDSFVLKGRDAEAIRAFFQPVVLELFETQRQIGVEEHGNTMCFYRDRKIVKPDQIKNLLGHTSSVFGWPLLEAEVKMLSVRRAGELVAQLSRRPKTGCVFLSDH